MGRLRTVTIVTIAVLVISAIVWSAPVRAEPETVPVPGSSMVSADALPTAQIDGVAYTQAIAGDTVYVGGEFTGARPAGVAAGADGSVPRTNLMAYDLATGELTDWAPKLSTDEPGKGQNAAVKAMALSPDGSRLYVGGDFTTIDGTPQGRIAAFRTSDGTLDPTFSASFSDTVAALAAADDGVFVGGSFGRTNDLWQGSVAKVDLAGATANFWRPQVDGKVRALTLTPDGNKLVVGGEFRTVNGEANPGMAALDVHRGAVTPWGANRLIRNYGTQAAITSLFADDTHVYGTGYTRLGADHDESLTDGNFQGTFAADPATGEIRWMTDCLGGTLSVAATEGQVFTAGDTYDCETMGGFAGGDGDPQPRHHSLGFSADATTTLLPHASHQEFAGLPAPGLLNWFPRWTSNNAPGQAQGPAHVATDGTYVVFGGAFSGVNDRAQQGLVRFVLKDRAPDALGPAVARDGDARTSADLKMVATPVAPGQVKINWQSTWDPDDSELEYTLSRNGTTIAQFSSESSFYHRPGLGHVDTLPAGASARYQVTVSDTEGDEAAATAGELDVVVPGPPLSAYAPAVLTDSPRLYWRLTERPGTPAVGDTAQWNGGTPGDGVDFGQRGALADGTGRAIGLNGSDGAHLVAFDAEVAPDAFTTEAWVRTTSTSGGKVIGFGNRDTGRSTVVDRHTWLEPSGRIAFGVHDGEPRTIQSAAAYNDGEWHHIVSSLGPAGMELWVDGDLVSSDPTRTRAQELIGWWRVGADAGWGPPGDLAGDVAEVAVYPTQLSGERIAAHREAALATAATATPDGPSDGNTPEAIGPDADPATAADAPSSPADDSPPSEPPADAPPVADRQAAAAVPMLPALSVVPAPPPSVVPRSPAQSVAPPAVPAPPTSWRSAPPSRTSYPTTSRPTDDRRAAPPPRGYRPTTDWRRVDRPTTERPRTSRPTTDWRRVDRPATERSRTNRPTLNEPRAYPSGVDRSRAHRPQTNRPTPSQSRAYRPSYAGSPTEQPRKDRPGTNHPRAYQPRTEWPERDHPATDRPQAHRSPAALPRLHPRPGNRGGEWREDVDRPKRAGRHAGERTESSSRESSRHRTSPDRRWSHRDGTGDRGDRTELAGRNDRGDRTELAGRNDRGDRTERAGRNDRGDNGLRGSDDRSGQG